MRAASSGVAAAAALSWGSPRSVCTQPGQTALTLMWVSASAFERAMVTEFSAALEA
jgi:hypothetical protein